MYEIYDGDLLLFTVDNRDEADLYRTEGYTVKKV